MSNVRYRVLKPCFVNGSLVEPEGKKPTYVHAQPGLAGAALELAPEEKPQSAAKAPSRPSA